MGTVIRFFMACVLLAAASVAPASDPIEVQNLHFAKGASSVTVKGSLQGNRTIDYRLGARAGQAMTVSLKSSNTANYFNVLPPGSTDVAIYVGSTGGNEWSGKLEANGDYTVRVYLMRSAARRNEKADYTLVVGIAGQSSGAAALGTAPASDAKVKGTPYHATGQVPCSLGQAPAGSAQCEFGVIRGQRGNAEVHLTLPAGKKRVLTFMGDTVTADSNAGVKASESGGMWSVDVNDYEHYQIVDAVIFGG